MVLGNDRYTYRVTWSEDDSEYVGLCAEFPSLSWLADTHECALEGIRNVVGDVVADMEKSGEKAPRPLATEECKGHISARVAPHVHRQLKIEAAEARISLNRLVSAKLTASTRPLECEQDDKSKTRPRKVHAR